MPAKRITTRTRLGFIGLGYLGSRIVQRLSAAGFPLVVWDVDDRKAAELSGPSVNPVRSAAELARKVDVVLSCLPNDGIVDDVYLGTGEVLKNTQRGATVIELSTVAPKTSQHLHEAGSGLGISVLDVAISGSTPAAESGTLTLFGGGERADFEAAEPIFRAIAAQWFYMGPGGSGVAMKLVVNTLLGVGMQTIAEALALGSKLGLPHHLLFDTLAKTVVVAPAHIGKLASSERSDYTPQFPIRLMEKDFALILDDAARLIVWMPTPEAAAAIIAKETTSGHEEDFSAVVQHMEQTAGKDWPSWD
jgi:3-hydroxyisobutyrate dehydrogenase-like beta-hydroxyacid dehydrogenase